jgi:hypothetical protein
LLGLLSDFVSTPPVTTPTRRKFLSVGSKTGDSDREMTRFNSDIRRIGHDRRLSGAILAAPVGPLNRQIDRPPEPVHQGGRESMLVC